MGTVTAELQEEGYLVNFGHKGTLEWKRFILTDQKSLA